jgi:Na+-driven multidrug efflux pump
MIPLLFAYCMFNVAKETEKTPIAGLAESCFMFYFAFSMDFFEVENTIAAPYFSKKNYRLFTIRTFRVAIVNFIFFCLSCAFVFVNKPLLQLLVLQDDEIADTTYFLTYYVPFVGIFFTLANFLRGMSTLLIFLKHN